MNFQAGYKVNQDYEFKQGHPSAKVDNLKKMMIMAQGFLSLSDASLLPIPHLQGVVRRTKTYSMVLTCPLPKSGLQSGL